MPRHQWPRRAPVNHVRAATEEPPCRAARRDRIAHITASVATPSAKLSPQESPTPIALGDDHADQLSLFEIPRSETGCQ
jgi:hypothetical protein